MSTAIIHGLFPRSFKCPYQANVIKRFEQASITKSSSVDLSIRQPLLVLQRKKNAHNHARPGERRRMHDDEHRARGPYAIKRELREFLHIILRIVIEQFIVLRGQAPDRMRKFGFLKGFLPRRKDPVHRGFKSAEPAVIEDMGTGERSEEHTSELQSPDHLVCRLLLEK